MAVNLCTSKCLQPTYCVPYTGTSSQLPERIAKIYANFIINFHESQGVYFTRYFKGIAA